MNTTPFETASCNVHLRVTDSGSQILTRRNPRAQTKLGDMPSLKNCVRLTYGHRNKLILLNSGESTESGEGEHYSGSLEHYLYSGSAEHKQCLGLTNEKGSTANAALWDDCFFNHEENQHYPDLDFDRVTERCADNLPSLRGEALRLQVTQSHLQNSSGVAQNSPDYIGSVNYESFVGQSLGSSFAFLRCSAFSLRPHASNTHEEKLALGLSAFSRSTLVSISSMSSCGNRIPLVEDLLFLEPVAILVSLCWCRDTIQEKLENKKVDVYVHLRVVCMCTLFLEQFEIAKPGSVTSTYRASNHNVTEAYTMAYSHSTQTRPKYQYRFLALSAIGRNVIHITATTEREAREQSPAGCVMVFAGRLPAQGVHHV